MPLKVIANTREDEREDILLLRDLSYFTFAFEVPSQHLCTLRCEIGLNKAGISNNASAFATNVANEYVLLFATFVENVKALLDITAVFNCGE